MFVQNKLFWTNIFHKTPHIVSVQCEDFGKFVAVPGRTPANISIPRGDLACERRCLHLWLHTSSFLWPRDHDTQQKYAVDMMKPLCVSMIMMIWVWMWWGMLCGDVGGGWPHRRTWCLKAKGLIHPGSGYELSEVYEVYYLSHQISTDNWLTLYTANCAEEHKVYLHFC